MDDRSSKIEGGCKKNQDASWHQKHCFGQHTPIKWCYTNFFGIQGSIG